MATDYAALAKEQGGSVDYGALAQQQGGITDSGADNTAGQPGFFKGLWDSVNPLPAIEHYASLGESEQQQIHQALKAGDYKTAASTLAKSLPGVDLATDIGKAQADQFRQGYEDFKSMPGFAGASSLAGHALAGALPVVGPAAAGAAENIWTPGKTGYGLGQATGLVLPFGLGEVSRLAKVPLSEAIRPAADAGVNDLAAQTTKRGQVLLQRKGPLVEQAGLTGAAPDVKAQTAATLRRVGPQIPAEVQRLNALGAVPDAQKMYDEIDTLRKANSSSNGTPFSEAYDARLAKAQDQLLAMATDPKKPPQFSDFDKLLDAWQNEAKTSYASPDASQGADAMKAASARIRGVLRNTQGADALNALNDEFAANKAANDLATMARPKMGLLGKAALRLTTTAIGTKFGNPVAGYLAAPMLEKAIMSGSVRNMPIAIRNSIADSIARGDMVNAERLATVGAQLRPAAVSQ